MLGEKLVRVYSVCPQIISLTHRACCWAKTVIISNWVTYDKTQSRNTTVWPADEARVFLYVFVRVCGLMKIKRAHDRKHEIWITSNPAAAAQDFQWRHWGISALLLSQFLLRGKSQQVLEQCVWNIFLARRVFGGNILRCEISQPLNFLAELSHALLKFTRICAISLWVVLECQLLDSRK